MDITSFNSQLLETKIRRSHWWVKASNKVDNHCSNNSGIMLTHHLEAVCHHIENIFRQPATGFYGDMFALLQQLQLDKKQVEKELRIVSLLHDIGKPEEDKSQIIPHPLTGKPAHMRHGVVSLMAAMEIIGADLIPFPRQQTNIYRTIELHDISYGMYMEYKATGDVPQADRLHYISNKINLKPSAGLVYLLIFKLADIHGHDNISDVIWFYNVVKENYFNQLHIDLPIPEEKDIR